MIHRNNYRCPKCGGKVKTSKIESDKCICRDCNKVLREVELDIKLKTYDELFGKRGEK